MFLFPNPPSKALQSGKLFHLYMMYSLAGIPFGMPFVKDLSWKENEKAMTQSVDWFNVGKWRRTTEDEGVMCFERERMTNG